MLTKPDVTWLPNSGVYVFAYGHRSVLDMHGLVHLSRYGAAEKHLAALVCTPQNPVMGMELRAVRFVIDEPTCLACIVRTSCA